MKNKENYFLKTTVAHYSTVVFWIQENHQELKVLREEQHCERRSFCFTNMLQEDLLKEFLVQKIYNEKNMQKEY